MACVEKVRIKETTDHIQGRHNSNCVCVADGPFRPDVAISATSLWASLQFPERSINLTFCLGSLYLRCIRLNRVAAIQLVTGHKKYDTVYLHMICYCLSTTIDNKSYISFLCVKHTKCDDVLPSALATFLYNSDNTLSKNYINNTCKIVGM